MNQRCSPPQIQLRKEGSKVSRLLDLWSAIRPCRLRPSPILRVARHAPCGAIPRPFPRSGAVVHRFPSSPSHDGRGPFSRARTPSSSLRRTRKTRRGLPNRAARTILDHATQIRAGRSSRERCSLLHLPATLHRPTELLLVPRRLCRPVPRLVGAPSTSPIISTIAPKALPLPFITTSQ